jgi:hypothetical protein
MPKTATPPTEEPTPQWPESTEKRHLRCELKPTDRDRYGRESADLVHKIVRLEDQKKASASSYKAAIDEQSARLKRISGYVSEGWEEREVQCQWMYESSGIDTATGESIYHPEKKALIRLDTKEVVEVRDITNDERQLALPISGESEQAAAEEETQEEDAD